MLSSSGIRCTALNVPAQTHPSFRNRRIVNFRYGGASDTSLLVIAFKSVLVLAPVSIEGADIGNRVVLDASHFHLHTVETFCGVLNKIKQRCFLAKTFCGVLCLLLSEG